MAALILVVAVLLGCTRAAPRVPTKAEQDLAWILAQPQLQQLQPAPQLARLLAQPQLEQLQQPSQVEDSLSSNLLLMPMVVMGGVDAAGGKGEDDAAGRRDDEDERGDDSGAGRGSEDVTGRDDDDSEERSDDAVLARLLHLLSDSPTRAEPAQPRHQNTVHVHNPKCPFCQLMHNVLQGRVPVVEGKVPIAESGDADEGRGEDAGGREDDAESEEGGRAALARLLQLLSDSPRDEDARPRGKQPAQALGRCPFCQLLHALKSMKYLAMAEKEVRSLGQGNGGREGGERCALCLAGLERERRGMTGSDDIPSVPEEGLPSYMGPVP